MSPLASKIIASAIIATLPAPIAGAALEESAYFQAENPEQVYDLLRLNGYRVEDDNGVSLYSVDGTRTQLIIFTDDTRVRGIRLNAWFNIQYSQAAEQAADYYEQTNPLSSISIVRYEDFTAIALQRDIFFGSGVTPANVLSNVALLYSIIPHFQSSLAASDPELAAFWSAPAEANQ